MRGKYRFLIYGAITAFGSTQYYFEISTLDLRCWQNFGYPTYDILNFHFLNFGSTNTQLFEPVFCTVIVWDCCEYSAKSVLKTDSEKICAEIHKPKAQALDMRLCALLQSICHQEMLQNAYRLRISYSCGLPHNMHTARCEEALVQDWRLGSVPREHALVLSRRPEIERRKGRTPAGINRMLDAYSNHYSEHFCWTTPQFSTELPRCVWQHEKYVLQGHASRQAGS